MLDAIGYNFRHLFDFSGRDARPTFWYWVLFVVLLNVVLSLAISIPLVISAVSAGMASGVGNPAAAEAAMAQGIAGMAEPLIWVSTAIGLANIVLLAASFVRRLHDSGRSALWAVVAGAVQVVTMVLALEQVGEAEAMIRQAAAAQSAAEAFAWQEGMAWQSLLGWVPLVILAVFGVMESDEGPNRYGQEPVRF